ncbi:hypothetical protein AURDEDRAFT_188887 [Auricularia subglabra TFB-10046 SS5]|uniref:Uncharacterized protein n=1 Tax=Auricularia subglabra (strain TFB-10046 / SS5) TaxID=717982 RepID=J0WQR1_AURST|nr:hypothetical protein AURDEDRAFT_188887 [Auricularia subglabra TFB-10046 SS5]
MCSTFLAEYLDGERTHPVWEPTPPRADSSAWSPSDRSRLKSLHLLESPSYQNPDLLLYQLGHLESLDPSFVGRLDDVLAGNGHVWLSNTSGTGKTRMTFEILARHCGLYLPCYVDFISDPYGSVDLSQAFSDISESWNSQFSLFVALSRRISQKSLDELERNRLIARSFFRRLVLGRMLILDEFRKLVSERRMPDREAVHAWLMVELRSITLLGIDIFHTMFTRLSQVDDAEVTRLIEHLSPELISQVSYIVIDEAQVALRTYQSAFADADNRRHAPVLRELVICLGEFFPAARLILSGVQFDLDVVSEALLASSFAQKDLRHYHSFGYFATLQQCSAYIRHFLGADLPTGACQTVFRWMHGRHRAIAVLVMLTLNHGPRSIISVMDSLLYRLTGYQRPGCAIIMSDVIARLDAVVTDEKLEASPAALVLRKATMTYAIHRLPTTTPLWSRDLVHLGLALYGRSAGEAALFEPFIFLNLVRWLASSREYGIHGIIRRCVGEDAVSPLRSVAFVEGLAACLADALRAAPTLETALVFPGRRPPWARHAGRIVLPRCGRRSSRPAPMPSNAPTLVHCAQTPTDVFDWMARASKPFLIPDALFGADMLFMVEVDGAYNVLVCVHADAFHSSRARRHVRVVPSSPDEFYKAEPDTQARLLTVLKSLPRLPLDEGHAGGRRTKARPRYAKYSTLHLFCFDTPFRDEEYNPPAANVNFNYLLQLPRPSELSFSSLCASISDMII